MPLPDSLWAEGKCSYKLIQYMSCGLPVVASPAGSNRQTVAVGKSGFLPNDKEWEEALVRLLESRELRNQMGRAGNENFHAKYSTEINREKLLSVLEESLNADVTADHGYLESIPWSAASFPGRARHRPSG